MQTTKYHSVCPLVGIGTPHPLSRKRVCTPPPPTKGEGTHSPADEGVGESQFRRLWALCLLCAVVQTLPGVAMSNQRSFKIGSFRFDAFVPKRSNVNVYKSKFWIETKRFPSVLKIFWPKAFVLFRFQKLFKLSKCFVLSSENPGAICNVLVSFWYHFFKIQKFCFDS